MNNIKGFIGEFKVKLAMRLLLWFGWKVYHNVTIQLSGGGTSQIDHIVVSSAGIFVVETKNYKGLIRVSENTNDWQQIFHHASYNFYSPIKQNKGHISALRFMLKTKKPPFYNLVCFVGDARFAGEPPKEVSIGAFALIAAIKRIHRKHKRNLTVGEVDQLSRAISDRRMPNTRKTRRIHLKNMKSR